MGAKRTWHHWNLQSAVRTINIAAERTIGDFELVKLPTHPSVWRFRSTIKAVDQAMIIGIVLLTGRKGLGTIRSYKRQSGDVHNN